MKLELKQEKGGSPVRLPASTPWQYLCVMKYYVVSFGCQMNTADTERIEEVLEESGFEPASSEEDADLLGIVACSVRQKAIDRVYGRIARWNKWKKQRPIITFLSGCVLEADEEKLRPKFDLLFRMPSLPELPEMLRQYGVPLPHMPEYDIDPETVTDFWKIPPKYSSDYQAWIPIQNGCNKFCSYCAVPYTRGREVSRDADEIVAQLISLVTKGYKSITLLGQNVNSYGLDNPARFPDFPGLMRLIADAVEQTGEQVWIYFTSPHPRDMRREVLEVMAEHSCFARQIHLPVQSGDDHVLELMNRSYTIDQYKSIIDNIHELLPDATVFTDVIVGFPGETEEAFLNTCQLFEQVKYNMAFIACYSPRPGVKSSKWEDQVAEQVKKERLHRLTAIMQKHTLPYNKKLIGNRIQVIVEGVSRKPGMMLGRSEGLLQVQFPAVAHAKPGSYLEIEITGATPMSLSGVAV